MPRVVNKSELRHKPYLVGVYVGRPSKWGNPFQIGRDGTRAEVVQKYRQFICERPDLIADAKEELCGHDLICWCAPLACHGDVLLEIANEPR